MHDIIQIKDEFRPFWTQNNLLGLEDFAAKMRGAEADEVKGMIESLKGEFAEGTSVDAEFFCVVARKAA